MDKIHMVLSRWNPFPFSFHNTFDNTHESEEECTIRHLKSMSDTHVNNIMSIIMESDTKLT